MAPCGNTATKWHCICDCENHTELDVLTSSLTSGNTRSCGCLRKEFLIKFGKEHRFISDSEYVINGKNKYDLSGEYGIGWTTSGDEFYFDLEDFNKIEEYIWSSKISGSGKKYAAVRRGTKNIFMHRLVLNMPSKDEDDRDVDHINHKTLDNRKQNLRPCEHYKNIIAQKTSAKNTSGRKGVHWDKSRNKWVARITYNKNNIFLGRFDSFEEAVKVREEAEKEYHKEFIYLDKE